MKQNIQTYSDLIKRYRDFLQTWYSNDQTEASRFNLFSILKIQWREAQVHTPFLAELLNPQGTHSQGELFYKEFIRTVLPNQEIFENVNTKYLYVKDEEGIKNGYIDIFIHHKDKANPFVIIIENKILAGNQDKQLSRYYESLKRMSEIDSDKMRILYLSLIEGLPSEQSIEKELREELIQKGILITISYKKEIINWLRSCIELVKAPKVHSSLTQYLLTLETICNE
jgi:PD-(D/E)XK nuclease superfamily